MNLFISTSSDKIYLAVFDNNEIKTELIHQGHNDHTQTLYGLIRDLDYNLEQITDIYVVNGPGSFTGLRVGVIFAKLLAQKNNANLYPVNALMLLTNMYNKQVALDARGGNYYILDENNEVILTKEINDSTLVDSLIDLSKLINNDYLLSLTPVNYLELEIVYVKHPIS